jgi:hypothetical protein
MYFPNNNFFRLEQQLVIDDRTLPSGDYFILVHASDGVNTRSEYIPLSLVEMPRRVTGFLSLQDNGIMRIKLSYHTPEFQQDTIFNLLLEYFSSGYNSDHGLFYLLTPQPSQLLAFPYREKDVYWSRQALPPYPSFSRPFVDDDLIIGTGNGEILVLDREGVVIIISPQDKDKSAGEIAANDEFIVCEMTSLNGIVHFLNIYYRITGGLHKSMKINGDVQTMLTMGDEFMVVTENGTASDIYFLEPDEGIFTLFNALPGGMAIGSARAAENIALILVEERIYRYDAVFNSLSGFAEINASGIIFEPLSSTVFCIEPHGVSVLHYPTGELLLSHTFQDPLLNFHILYNK